MEPELHAPAEIRSRISASVSVRGRATALVNHDCRTQTPLARRSPERDRLRTAGGGTALLVDLPADTSLFAVLALEGALERIVKVKVDLATADSLKPTVRARALADAVVL